MPLLQSSLRPHQGTLFRRMVCLNVQFARSPKSHRLCDAGLDVKYWAEAL